MKTVPVSNQLILSLRVIIIVEFSFSVNHIEIDWWYFDIALLSLYLLLIEYSVKGPEYKYYFMNLFHHQTNIFIIGRVRDREAYKSGWRVISKKCYCKDLSQIVQGSTWAIFFSQKLPKYTKQRQSLKNTSSNAMGLDDTGRLGAGWKDHENHERTIYVCKIT